MRASRWRALPSPHCGDALMNDHLRQALLADRHPTISFALTSDQLARAVQAGSAPVAVNGTLTIAGRSDTGVW